MEYDLTSVTIPNTVKVTFFDLLGKEVLNINTYFSEDSILIQNLKIGTYLLKVEKNNSVILKRFVKVE